MKYIASCSFGKDSLAAIITRMEHGDLIDGAVYCRIMFDNETSAELPEHEEWIYTHAMPLLKARYGIEVSIAYPKRTYCDYFYLTYGKGEKIGKIYGFPFLRGPWCNSRLKTRPMVAWGKTVGEHTQILGIAADEKGRAKKDTVKGKILPLVDHGITEAEAFDICRKAELLSPAYNNGRTRLGCWFCHNQRISELRRLWKEHPALWAKLMRLDRDSPVTFKSGNTIRDFEERFSTEAAQMTLFDFIKEG